MPGRWNRVLDPDAPARAMTDPASESSASAATEIPPGTLVMLGHIAAHMELDLVWAFRSIGWEVVIWGNDDERAFSAAIRDMKPPALVAYPEHERPAVPLAREVSSPDGDRDARFAPLRRCAPRACADLRCRVRAQSRGPARGASSGARERAALPARRRSRGLRGTEPGTRSRGRVGRHEPIRLLPAAPRAVAGAGSGVRDERLDDDGIRRSRSRASTVAPRSS